MWDSLSRPWQVCVEEAWAAYCAGSLPIGAAVTGGDGRIIARGRNRIFERSAEAALLYGHPLAHAEMNALILLDYTSTDPSECAIYTTAEPCPLCTGAIRMARIANVNYASRDPPAGSIDLLEATPFMRGRVNAAGPERADFEVALVAMRVECLFRMGFKAVAEMLGAGVPQGFTIGRALFESGQLHAMREAGVDAAAMLPALAGMV
jgi:tRNA(adenine34) deaminase